MKSLISLLVLSLLAFGSYSPLMASDYEAFSGVVQRYDLEVSQVTIDGKVFLTDQFTETIVEGQPEGENLMIGSSLRGGMRVRYSIRQGTEEDATPILDRIRVIEE